MAVEVIVPAKNLGNIPSITMPLEPLREFCWKQL